MQALTSRRTFLRATAGGGLALALGQPAFLSRLQPVSAAEAALDPRIVRFSDESEPLVRFLEDTPRDKLVEEVAIRVRDGLAYRELLAALLLAGVRNIQPRPVGFKFHAVLVVNSAHLASISSPEAHRWLPIFWALDQFKSSQARDMAEGDWTMGPIEESKVPSPLRARQAFLEAMDQWDETAADAAVVGLVRSAGAQEIFELFCRYGARDFRNIGHKAIYVANSWRTLQAIGWQHAEPVLRSLAYALLDRDGNANPSESNLPADRPGRRNLELRSEFPETWLGGTNSTEASIEMLETVRSGSALDASQTVVALLERGVSPQSIWDGLFQGAAELLMREPGILSLHAVTTTNALHYSWLQCGWDATRRFLLLQAAAFLPLFRRNRGGAQRIDQWSASGLLDGKRVSIEEVFSEVNQNNNLAAAKALAWLQQNPRPREFIDAARVLIFSKGTNSHDYKFSSAALEDYAFLSPGLRDRYLAASVFNLRGSSERDTELAQRIRATLAG